jgi:hypothetical protein
MLVAASSEKLLSDRHEKAAVRKLKWLGINKPKSWSTVSLDLTLVYNLLHFRHVNQSSNNNGSRHAH